MSQLDFAALLCSRLCHDLVSPVGAISNGLELLSDGGDPTMQEQVLDLISKSALQTSNKLQFFRLAFGAAGGFSDNLDFEEAQKAITNFLEGSRVELEWDVTPGTGSKGIIKAVLNMALVVSECLIRGGTLKVQSQEEGGARRFVVGGSGQRVIVQDSVDSVLNGEKSADGMEARTAPVMLIREVATDLGAQVNVTELSDTQFELTLTL